MFAGFIAVELFRWCKKKNFTIKMPDTVPDFVSRSFEMIPISVIIIGFFLIVRIVCVNVLNTMPPLIFTAIFAPLVGSMDNPIAYTFLNILLWYSSISIKPNYKSNFDSILSRKYCCCSSWSCSNSLLCSWT